MGSPHGHAEEHRRGCGGAMSKPEVWTLPKSLQDEFDDIANRHQSNAWHKDELDALRSLRKGFPGTSSAGLALMMSKLFPDGRRYSGGKIRHQR